MAGNEEEYEEFVDKVAEKSLWKTGDKPRYGGQILMLSTCDNGRGDDWRIVVIGKEECVRFYNADYLINELLSKNLILYEKENYNNEKADTTE